MLVGRLLSHATATPAKTALVYNGEPLTYAQLADAVGGLVGEISDAGLAGPGIVVIAIDDLRAAWLAMLALRLCGATTLVLSSIDLLPTLHLTGLRAVVRAEQETWPSLAQACADRVLPLVALRFDREGRLPALPACEGGHILQTSGTTGLAKFVLYDPTFEPAYFRTFGLLTGITSDTVGHAFHFPLWTAIGYRRPFTILLNGGTFGLHRGRPPHEALRLRTLTTISVTPALLRAILAAPLGSFDAIANLHVVVTSGTASFAEIEEAKARIGGRIENRIGATEAQTLSGTFVVTPEDSVWHQGAPGVRVEVVDEFGVLCPPEQVGALRVETTNAPTAYLDDPATSAQFFRDGFFYPGDLAIAREDGRFMLQGRVTDIINVDGYKRAPAPVEDKLAAEFGLRGLCLVSLVNESNAEDLYVVVESDVAPDNATLGAALRRELGTFPAAHVFVTSHLPRNAMGKLMRAEVKAMVLAQMREHSP